MKLNFPSQGIDFGAIYLSALLSYFISLEHHYVKNRLLCVQGKFAAFNLKKSFFFTGATTHCGFVFCSPLAGL